MSFGKTAKIGKQGKAGKWVQPPGTSLYRYESTRRFQGTTVQLVVSDIYSDTGSTIIRVRANKDGVWNSQNTFVLFESFSYKQASSNWTSPGVNPRLYLRQYPVRYNLGEFVKEQAHSESPDCTEANQIVDTVSMPKRVFTYDDAQTEEPGMYFNIDWRDNPTSFSICTLTVKCSVLVLLPTEGIREAKEPNVVTGDTLTLVNKT